MSMPSIKFPSVAANVDTTKTIKVSLNSRAINFSCLSILEIPDARNAVDYLNVILILEMQIADQNFADVMLNNPISKIHSHVARNHRAWNANTLQ